MKDLCDQLEVEAEGKEKPQQVSATESGENGGLDLEERRGEVKI